MKSSINFTQNRVAGLRGSLHSAPRLRVDWKGSRPCAVSDRHPSSMRGAPCVVENGSDVHVGLVSTSSCTCSSSKPSDAAICDSIVPATSQVVAATARYRAFHEVGKRLLHAWNDGMSSRQLQKTGRLPSQSPSRGQALLPNAHQPRETREDWPFASGAALLAAQSQRRTQAHSLQVSAR